MEKKWQLAFDDQNNGELFKFISCIVSVYIHLSDEK